jgi:hypothetical protein
MYSEEKQLKAIKELVDKLERFSNNPDGIAFGMAKLQYYPVIAN